ncbi:QacE family quaternary ammonium compound efflux SMR transporter [Deinococcus piscis]|uniref:QacE family quaternary ammonium compound efflux SMR transporter n=1 Tax=Deinococcus piscis TaxID=394230 RepID=A0ABQ3JYZ8_9DEIO|nr:multidrug efflux SMR transporter [Deinococcus piscis]GHF94171.1 QacE family quaternary ammonium compound efflux SMR transporter [Deinococcus piscis]
MGTEGLGWTALLLAGVLEVGFTTALKLEQRDKRYIWLFLVCAVLSFGFLQEAMKTIPLGTAYTVWTGIGAVGTVLVGAAFFGERLNRVQLGLLALVVALIAALRLTGSGA